MDYLKRNWPIILLVVMLGTSGVLLAIGGWGGN